jgi:hypothetical protein
MNTDEFTQYILEQLEKISSGISERDLRKISLLHGMNKEQLMTFLKENLEFLGTLPINEISNFVKIYLFIMIEKYMLDKSTANAMKEPLFQTLHLAMNLESPEQPEQDFYRNYKVPCFDLLCVLYAKIRSLITPATSDQFRETKQFFIDIVCDLIPDIHYLLDEKYPIGSDDRYFFFGTKPDQFETLGLFQKFFFEITYQQFESVSFSESDIIYRRTIQKLFEEINTTLQKV